MLQFLNYFFFVFHGTIILLNLFGWIFRRTRKLNLILLLLTAFSWFVLGIWHGWGYCLFTDWHYDVREKLGYDDMSHSYIHFLILKATGFNFPMKVTEQATAIVFFICLFLSLRFNYRDYRRKKTQQPPC